MNETIISNMTTAEIAAILCKISSKQVIDVPSIGDASSPVRLTAGQYVQQIGQCGDYRHEVASHAKKIGALSVIGYWDNNRWLATVSAEYAKELVAEMRKADLTATTGTEEAAQKNLKAVRRTAEIERYEADRPAREARQTATANAVAERKAELKHLFEAAVAKCRLKKNGKVHGGDMREVERAYRGATEGYAEDRAHWLIALTRLAQDGPAVTV